MLAERSAVRKLAVMQATVSSAGSVATALRVVTGLVLVEGLLLVAAGAWLLVATVTGSPDSLGTALFLALLALVAGAGLAWLSRPLLRGRRWARSPVVVAQLLALPVGAGLVQGALYRYAVPDLALAVTVLGLLAVPAARVPFEPPRGGAERASAPPDR
jgi:phosphate/sulfate permease